MPVTFVKIQSIVSEEKFFEGRVYGRTHAQPDRLTNAMTIARWLSASGAKKTIFIVMQQFYCY